MNVKDCHGAELVSEDSVVVIKDLKVKGASMTIKRGMSRKNLTFKSLKRLLKDQIRS